MKLKLMIFGYARHGKDTVAEIYAKAFGIKFISSSYAAAETVMMPYFEARGQQYNTVEECFADRVNHRKAWHEQIKVFNTPDKTRLAREIYDKSDAYVGIRDKAEFEAIRDAGLFQYSIWVDASKRHPAESSESCSVYPGLANYILDNNGTLEQLEVNARALYWDLVSLEYAAKGH